LVPEVFTERPGAYDDNGNLHKLATASVNSVVQKPSSSRSHSLRNLPVLSIIILQQTELCAVMDFNGNVIFNITLSPLGNSCVVDFDIQLRPYVSGFCDFEFQAVDFVGSECHGI